MITTTTLAKKEQMVKENFSVLKMNSDAATNAMTPPRTTVMVLARIRLYVVGMKGNVISSVTILNKKPVHEEMLSLLKIKIQEIPKFNRTILLPGHPEPETIGILASE